MDSSIQYKYHRHTFYSIFLVVCSFRRFSNEKVGMNPLFDEIAKDSFDQTVEDSFDITDRNQDKWSTSL